MSLSQIESNIMMAFIFLLFCVFMVLAWRGQRIAAIYTLLLFFISTCATFFHHLSSQLHLNL